MRLDGKAALITGAGSGIGRALALEGARRGLRLVLAGRREAALEETIALIGLDRPVLTVPADITDAGDRQRLVAAVTDELGGLDILVNNAGTVAVGPLAQTTDAEIETMVRVNLAAPMALTRDVLPMLRRSVRGHIVNVGSVFGDIAFPYFVGYSATKFGLRGFSDAARRELAQYGIAVTYVAPRATATPAASRFEALIGPMAMRLDRPETTAAQIWRAVARNKREAFPRGPERFLVRLQRMLPRLVDRNLEKQAQAPRVRDAIGSRRESAQS